MVTPIARLTSEYEVIVVPSKSPHQKLADLLAAFKANPGSVAWGGGSAGGTDHILVGLDRQGDRRRSVQDQLRPIQGRRRSDRRDRRWPCRGRRVAVSASSPNTSRPAACARSRCRVRSREEGIPTLKEQGVNVELGNWRGVFGGPNITDGAARRAGQGGQGRDRVAAVEGHAAEDRLGRRGTSAATTTRSSSTRTSSASRRSSSRWACRSKQERQR